MARRTLSFILTIVAMCLATVSGFAPIVPAAIEVSVGDVQTPEKLIIGQSTSSMAMQSAVENYVKTAGASSSLDSSTMTLSLKERPPPPTKEEIEAKKRNFNLWFWGGGFVAPFIATVYYFGPKFWTK